MHALRPDLPDGSIARYVGAKFRIVATGFHFTNEIRMDAREEYLYVAETTGGCISRLRVHVRDLLLEAAETMHLSFDMKRAGDRDRSGARSLTSMVGPVLTSGFPRATRASPTMRRRCRSLM